MPPPPPLDLAQQQVADDLVAHTIDLLRLEAGTRAQIMKLLLDLQDELVAKLQREDLTAFTKARFTAMLKQVSETIDGYYAQIQADAEGAMAGAARAQVAQASAVFRAQLAFTLPTETFLSRLVSNVLILGAPSADWWSRQSGDTQFRFAAAVRQGLAASETNEQIVARIRGTKEAPGVMEISARGARALVHTSIQTVANSSRLALYRGNSRIYTGVRQLSTLDARTSPICIAYSGGEWDLDGAPMQGTTLPFVNPGGSVDGVPRHWNCRSVLMGITRTFRELGLDIGEFPPGKRASDKGPVSATMTFENWLSRRTTAQQDEQLGAGRAELWREGKLTLPQLLDLRGNPLTVAQLQARYE